jgi:hypothetical protein
MLMTPAYLVAGKLLKRKELIRLHSSYRRYWMRMMIMDMMRT